MRVGLVSRLNYTSFKSKNNIKSRNDNSVVDKQIRQGQDKTELPKKIIYQEPKIRVVRFEPMYTLAGSGEPQGGNGEIVPSDYSGSKSNMLNTIPEIKWENDL